jgi:hypothetical protein
MSRPVCSRVLILAAVLAAGCSGGRTVPVSGKVTLADGAPARGATVCFTDTANSTSASGVCDDDGRFQLTTFARDDGAPPGTYRVTVHHPAPADSSQPQTASLFHPRYENPDTSGLQFAVEKRSNQIDIVLDKP